MWGFFMRFSPADQRWRTALDFVRHDAEQILTGDRAVDQGEKNILKIIWNIIVFVLYL